MSPATPARWSRGHPLVRLTSSSLYLPTLVLFLSFILALLVSSSRSVASLCPCAPPPLSARAVFSRPLTSVFLSSIFFSKLLLCELYRAHRKDNSSRIRNYIPSPPLINRCHLFFTSLFYSLFLHLRTVILFNNT